MSVLNESRPFGVLCSPDLGFLFPCVALLAYYPTGAESGGIWSRARTLKVPMISTPHNQVDAGWGEKRETASPILELCPVMSLERPWVFNAVN